MSQKPTEKISKLMTVNMAGINYTGKWAAQVEYVWLEFVWCLFSCTVNILVISLTECNTGTPKKNYHLVLTRLSSKIDQLDTTPTHILVKTYPASCQYCRMQLCFSAQSQYLLQMGNIWIVPLLHSVSDLIPILIPGINWKAKALYRNQCSIAEMAKNLIRLPCQR